MSSANRTARRLTSFGRRWAVPILVGSGGGLVYIVLTLEPLGDRFGAAGGVLASVAGIGLGLLMSLFAAMFGQMARGATAAPDAGRP